MACWDIIGKAVEQPVYNLLGGKVHERLRSYTYLYPAAGEGDEFYHDAERSAERVRRSTWRRVSPGLKFDPTGGFSAYDPRQPTQEALERTVRLVRLVREAVGHRADLLAGHPWPVHHLRRHSPGEGSSRPYRSAVVRGAGAARDAGADGHRGPRHQHPHRHRRTPHHQVRVRARAGDRRRQHRADESWAASAGLLEAKKVAALAEVHYAQIAPHLYCGPGGRRREHPDRRLLAQFSDPRKHPAMGRNSRASCCNTPIRWEQGYVIPPTAPGLGVELERSRGAAPIAYVEDGPLHLEMINRPLGLGDCDA
jgi:galactonate dehydratase